jgi:hypothetical protein
MAWSYVAEAQLLHKSSYVRLFVDGTKNIHAFNILRDEFRYNDSGTVETSLKIGRLSPLQIELGVRIRLHDHASA